MELKVGDVILVNSIIDQNNERNNYWCNVWYSKLVGLPTKVLMISHGEPYITHPTLDLVPWKPSCIDFELIEDLDVGSHNELKSKQKLIKKMGMNKIPKSHISKVFKPKKLNEDSTSLSATQQKWLNLLSKLESNEIDVSVIEKHFGSLGKFIDTLRKQNLFSHIDPFSDVFSEYQNTFFYYFYKNNNNFIWEIVDRYLSDIAKIGDDYYYDADYSDLAGLFSTGRSDFSRDTIEELLSGNYDTHFWDVSEDVHRDAYEELSPDKKQLVNNRISEELKKLGTIGTITDLLEEIAEEQNREDVELTDEVITRLLSDEDTVRILINQELDDIRSDLYSLYSSCYSDILTSGWSNQMWGALVGEVIDDENGEDYSYKKSVWLKDGTRGTKTVYGQRFKVTKCLYDVVTKWLDDNKDKGSYNDNSIEYFGSYMNLLKDCMDYGTIDEIRAPRVDEYPDYREMERCVNGGVDDYF
jgi:hypothetical protein